MYWQVVTDMYFRMAGGWTGWSPFEFERMPIVNYLHGAMDLPEAADQLKTYLARFEVRAIIADPGDSHFDSWQPMFAGLGVPGENTGGVRIYKIPPKVFDSYANLSGAAVEARANALRFDIILTAVARYLAEHRDPATLSPSELKRLDMLPSDWVVASTRDAFADWSVSSTARDSVAIATRGSRDGVKPLLDRYAGAATEILYPAPRKWTREAVLPYDTIASLLIVFSRAQLEAAAAQLRAAPPPELTTSFIAGVSAYQMSER